MALFSVRKTIKSPISKKMKSRVIWEKNNIFAESVFRRYISYYKYICIIIKEQKGNINTTTKKMYHLSFIGKCAMITLDYYSKYTIPIFHS